MSNEKEVNLDSPDKPVGSTQKMLKSRPKMKYEDQSQCHVSVEDLYTSVDLGAREFFQRYGYMIIRGLWNPKEFQEVPPKERGQIKYYGKLDQFEHTEIEKQVNGSLARYNHPKYKYSHSQIRIKLEKILGQKLYNTYYYDRFYFVGQRLYRHIDRPSCEISLTYQISSNSKKPWPICFETPDGKERYVELNDGDAVLYKGCEREHWREPLLSNQNLIQKLMKKDDNTYHHQIFFHYVLANGCYAHHAYDR